MLTWTSVASVREATRPQDVQSVPTLEKSLSILEMLSFVEKTKTKKCEGNAESTCIRRFASQMLREVIVPLRNERKHMFLRGMPVADLH